MTHGREHVVTLWYCLFIDRDECIKFATNFSKINNIVESSGWANLMPENGIDGGGNRGMISKVESREKISESLKGRKNSEETKRRKSMAKIGKKHSSQHNAKISAIQLKPCTVDGKTVYPSVRALVKSLGAGVNGRKSPRFRFVNPS